MPADDAAASSPSVSDLQRQIDELAAELRARTADYEEALRREAAVAQVLQVINASPGDLAPVFDAMLDKATRLSEAAFGILWTYDGERFQAVAFHDVPPAYVEFLQEPQLASPVAPLGRVAQGEAFAHVADLAADEYQERAGFLVRQGLSLGGFRTVLAVPMRKDASLLGAITIYRREVQPFSDKQIALLQNFAAQAVIAMENARLINETRDALEQQTATAEVLQVINSSPGDLTPVFETILEKAHALCAVAHGTLHLYDGEMFRAVAVHGLPEPVANRLRQGFTPGPNLPAQRMIEGEDFVHVRDLAEVDDSIARSVVEGAGIRTVLFVALRKEGTLLGQIVAARQEIRPFSEKEIALLASFAAQAVIAMENARLINETREALEQQTATAEVLRVINSSPGDLAPVFETILEKAHTLCGVAYGSLQLYDGAKFRAVAVHGLREALAIRLRQGYEPGPNLPVRRLLDGEDIVHVADIAEIDDPFARTVVEQGGLRTLLHVALRKDGALLGQIVAAREEVRPFADKEISLLRSFAAQAVIAMENARLLTELREALAQQTATAEVLRVINSSPGNLAPVFQTILDKARALCSVARGSLQLYDGERLHAVAVHGLTEALAIRLKEGYVPGADHPIRRLLKGEDFVHSHDIAEIDDPGMRAAVELGGIRTRLAVALRKDSVLLGQIVTGRQEVRPFTDKEIALMQSFAAQAVIAIENARLLTEQREALEQQTATAEVLQVINSSPGDLVPVFDSMLEKAMHLCGAAFGILWTYDGEWIRAAAVHGATAAYAQFLTSTPHRPGLENAHGRLLRGERFVHIADAGADAAYWSDDPLRRATVELGGTRTLLAVPLRQDNVFLGDIVIYRRHVQPFSEKQIALLENFAAQAVIAIDNARLLDELRQRQAELRVTFDNMGDGVAMFDADLRLAAWNRNFQEIIRLSDADLAARPTYAEYLRLLAERGEFGAENVEAALATRLQDTDKELRLQRTRPDGTVIEARRNAVPGGGFVLIYADITERKRAEAEISTARDAAEAALRDLQTAQASLLHSQKMAALGQLTAGIAHEIKNPLNFVNNFADLSVEILNELKEATAPAVTTLDDDKRNEIDESFELLTSNLDKIAGHGRRADGIVRSMLAHSRGGSGDWQRVDLNGVVEEALNLAYHGARAQDQSFNVTLERDLDGGLAPIEIVPQDVTRVLLNLIGNSFHATTKRGRQSAGAFKPVLKVATRDLGDTVEIRVRDNGTGIAPEHRDRLFQPFFTTKATGEGTGLGLSISYDIIAQQHGGTITVDSEVGAFTEFIVRLPRRRHVTTAGTAT
jgi:two-component system NtrC family sensor kinase